MSRFEYDLIDERGRRIPESLEADDYPSAMRAIQERGFCTRMVEVTEFGERIVHVQAPGLNLAGCAMLLAFLVVPLTLFVGLELAGQGIGVALGLPLWGQVVSGFVLMHLSFKLFLWWSERRVEQQLAHWKRNVDPEIENKW